MYNENQKQEFIKYYLQNSATKFPAEIKITLTSIFNKAEAYENLYEHDISEMTYSELLNTMSRISTTSISYRREIKHYLNIYIEWSISNGYTHNVENACAMISLSEIDNTHEINSLFYSPQELVNVCDIIFYSPKEQRLDLSIRCTFYLEFLGFKMKEISKMKNEDLDIVNHTVCGVKVYDEFWSALLIMQNLDSFCRTYAISGEKNFFIPASNPDCLIKTLKQDLTKIVKYGMSKPRRENPSAKRLTQYNVRYSGLLYSAVLEEKETGGCENILKKIGKGQIFFLNDLKKYKEIAADKRATT